MGRDLSNIHYSDCAVYRGPAYVPGPCNCGATKAGKRWWAYLYRFSCIWLARLRSVLRSRLRTLFGLAVSTSNQVPYQNERCHLCKDDIKVIRDGDMWSAYCDRLGLDSFGTTESEARMNLICAITLYIQSLAEKGILFERMKEKGIRVLIRPVFDSPPRRTASKSRGNQMTPVLVG